MRYPKSLEDGGNIGFVAPSFGCATEPYISCFEETKKNFKSMGYKLDIGPNCGEAKGIGISNDPKLCGQELEKYYCSGDNDILISCGGGELMCETISNVDFEKIKKAEPKWFMGFSDNTNMTFLLTTLCDVASIYGPCAAAFGMKKWHKCLNDSLEILEGKRNFVEGYDMWEKEGLKDEEHPLEPYNLTEKRDSKIYLPKDNFSDGNNKGKKVEIEGRLIGGCMDCLVNLLGTKYDGVRDFNEKYKEDGFIWFLESCDLNVMSIRRAVWQMKNAGWFEKVKGFMIGRPYCFGQEMMGLDQYRAVTDLLKEYGVPIIMDVDLGHLPPSMPIVCGSYGKLTMVGNEIKLEYQYK